MENVCIVTGGGSGMGLEAARILGKDQIIILVGRTVSKLDQAMAELKSLGINVQAFPCDAGDRESVKKLASYALEQGKIKTVIHAAGVSPHMSSAENIFKINAIGTINIVEELAPVMEEGGCILNVSSMAAYMLPESKVPKQMYQLSLQNIDAFQSAANQMISSVPKEQQAGLAYTVSKNFVVWYTSRVSVLYGKKGIRIISISPGTFRTPMGEVEGEAAASFAINGAMGRLGEPEEIAKMMAFMVSDECSYLCGVDILYDGGSISAMRAMQEEMVQ